ncbi:D-Ala-D-Ala carboxypeptidase VanY [Paenibacillus sp. HW567]|uniref:D-Ala-D-Ala carboxypeptidase VanY n=1 Tax=Paenibacillus sp. HW567 TaxID=1034769 RepID=UPI00035E3522|nr:D-Ala-D-Ala carboxypeptidase VanY [Paenibacillus sp. HW567]
MKKWLFLCIVLLVVGFRFYQKEESSVKYRPDSKTVAVQSETEGSEKTIHIDKEQIYEGNLILVNKDYPIHKKGTASDIIKLSQHEELTSGFSLLDHSIRLSQSVTEQFARLTEAAAKEGVTHFRISSGYRDSEEQEVLYREKGADYALPAGYSEHNSGLSLDIGSTLGEIGKAPEGDWLKANAWSYGFILRYPEDKTAITGIKYEAWHFRYAGLPHSQIMKDKNMVLEEYLEYLKQQQSVQITVDNRKYLVLYAPVSKNTSIQIPAGHPYEISGNNSDGVIVTVLLSTWKI